jgi:hypothetical protein
MMASRCSTLEAELGNDVDDMITDRGIKKIGRLLSH